MASPLEGSIASQIYKGLKSLFYSATLLRDVVPSSPSYDAADPPAAVETSYSCLAMVESYADYLRASGMVSAKDRKILVLANSLSVTPTENDRMTIRGVTFRIMQVDVDPALACWVLQGRM